MRGGYYSAAGDAETTVSTLWGDLMYCSDCGRLVCACPGEGVIRCRYGRPAEILAEIERALYSLKYGEIYKEIKYGDL